MNEDVLENIENRFIIEEYFSFAVMVLLGRHRDLSWGVPMFHVDFEK